MCFASSMYSLKVSGSKLMIKKHIYINVLSALMMSWSYGSTAKFSLPFDSHLLFLKIPISLSIPCSKEWFIKERNSTVGNGFYGFSRSFQLV